MLTASDEVICRYEEITETEILEAIRDRAESVNDIKMSTRAGMGLCQGRTCRGIISQMLARAQNRPLKDILLSTFRPPVRPIKLSVLAAEDSTNFSNERRH